MVACADENVEIDLLKRKRSAIRSFLTGKDSGADLFSIRIANCPVVDPDIPGVKTREKHAAVRKYRTTRTLNLAEKDRNFNQAMESYLLNRFSS